MGCEGAGRTVPDPAVREHPVRRISSFVAFDQLGAVVARARPTEPTSSATAHHALLVIRIILAATRRPLYPSGTLQASRSRSFG